jgi:hypothetical protein
MISERGGVMKAFVMKEIGSVGFIENRRAVLDPMTQLYKLAGLSFGQLIRTRPGAVSALGRI